MGLQEEGGREEVTGLGIHFGRRRGVGVGGKVEQQTRGERGVGFEPRLTFGSMEELLRGKGKAMEQECQGAYLILRVIG